MTRDQMIDHLVSVSNDWGITTPSGKPYTREIFSRADDAWLKKQIKSMNRQGACMAAAQ